MHNVHDTNHEAPGFGKNTNGTGIFLLAALFVGLTLFVWWSWNNDHKELNYYRVEKAAAAPTETHSGH